MSSPMTLDGYQNLAAKTAIYPGRNSFLGLMYVTGKLNGEAGEAAEETFKALRDDDIVRGITYKTEILESIPTEELIRTFEPNEKTINVTFGPLDEKRRLKLKKELGDILWYVSQAAHEIGYTLSEIAEGNIHKLSDRHGRGVLSGSGNDR